MRDGGPYHLISRTLGAELGGAIGVLLVFEHIVGAVYYLSTISEILFLANSTVRVTHCVTPDSLFSQPFLFLI
jgi:amino acid transporter